MRSKKANKTPKGVAITKDATVGMETFGSAVNNRKRKSAEVSQEVKLKNKKEEEPTANITNTKEKKKNNRFRNNKNNKPPKPQNGATNDAESPTEEISIAYLKLWKEDRAKWKFQKLRQMWLNDNMLDNTKLPDNMFPIWIEYMEGSSPGQKKVIIQKATDVLKELEAMDDTVDSTNAKCQRARMIIQSFDDDDDDDEDDDDDDDDEEEDNKTS